VLELTWVLGLHTGHEASAVLFDGGRMVAAVSDERLTRVKNDGGRLSDLAIDAVLQIAGRKRADIERLALLYTFFPEEYFVRETWYKELERRFSRWRHARANGERPQMLLSNFIGRLGRRGKSFEPHFLRSKFLRREGFAHAAADFFGHHDAHALAAAVYSGFAECAVFTMDGSGDIHENHTSGIFRAGRYERKRISSEYGSSAGLFYSHITRLLGFRALRHEGKVVGLAAMGDPEPLYALFGAALKLSADGHSLSSDFVGQEQAEAKRFAFLRDAIKGHSRENVAAAAQKRLEDVATQLVCNFLAETGLKHVALNGGVFANVKLNQRIAALSAVETVFVFPAMSDTGNSIGAVLLEHAARSPQLLCDHAPLAHVYLGPEYDPEQIATELVEAGLPQNLLQEEALISAAAQAIHSGKVVGWFQGRMEFGPRALGNRSMLARPTDVSINDWLNQRLDRSEFMPFAPSVLAEHAGAIFEGVEKARHTAEFMTITFDVRPEWRARIPAVVHVDGTARPQLVRAATNPLYHKLICAYQALSGIPLVLNTSFNVHEEPIVCAPREAIRAFVEKRVDCLGIGPYWLAHP
jgi:carbamoyltransferase